MSRRVFYIVHLDKGRIASLALFGTGLLLATFATGYRLANRGDSVSLPAPENNTELAFKEQRDRILGSPDQEAGPSDQGNEPEGEKRRDEPPVRDEEQELRRTPSPEAEPPAKSSDRKPEKVNLLDSAMNEERQSGTDDIRRNSRSEPEIDRIQLREETKKNEQPSRKERQKRDKKKEPKKELNRKQNEKKTKEKTADRSDNSPVKKPTIRKEKETAPGTSEDAKPDPDVFVLQMGAYQSREAALRLSEQIRKHGINTYVRQNGSIHTVRTDGTANRDELYRLEKKLKGLNFTPVTVMLKGNR